MEAVGSSGSWADFHEARGGQVSGGGRMKGLPAGIMESIQPVQSLRRTAASSEARNK